MCIRDRSYSIKTYINYLCIVIIDCLLFIVLNLVGHVGMFLSGIRTYTITYADRPPSFYGALQVIVYVHVYMAWVQAAAI